ncbi:hypothetical protein ACTFIY_004372 [Dictyostelium cf. discoideum]
MYNPPPPSGSQGNNNYYRQPSSTPGVSNPNPQANQFLPPPPSNTQAPRPGFPPSAPPPSAPAGQYSMPPPPQQQQQAGQYGMPPPPSGSGIGTGVSLVKDQQISLSKEDPYLRKLTVGLGWDVNTTPSAPFDLDAVVFMLGANGMVRQPADFIFYNNKQSRDGSIFHHGDNLTGAGDGDDEVVSVNLQAVSPDVTRLVFAVTIHQPELRRQNFGMVPRAFIRIANQETTRNICRYDLTNEGGTNTAMIVGEVYRDPQNPQHWSFIAVGKSFPGGLQFLCQIFGVNYDCIENLLTKLETISYVENFTTILGYNFCGTAESPLGKIGCSSGTKILQLSLNGGKNKSFVVQDEFSCFKNIKDLSIYGINVSNKFFETMPSTIERLDQIGDNIVIGNSIQKNYFISINQLTFENDLDVGIHSNCFSIIASKFPNLRNIYSIVEIKLLDGYDQSSLSEIKNYTSASVSDIISSDLSLILVELSQLRSASLTKLYI